MGPIDCPETWVTNLPQPRNSPEERPRHLRVWNTF